MEEEIEDVGHGLFRKLYSCKTFFLMYGSMDKRIVLYKYPERLWPHLVAKKTSVEGSKQKIGQYMSIIYIIDFFNLKFMLVTKTPFNFNEDRQS